MTLDEHLLIYLCTVGGARFGARDEIEKRLMDFLFSLKYYCQRWERARIYAYMLGFLLEGEKVAKKDEIIGLPQNYRINSNLISHLDNLDGIIDDIDSPLHDTYSKEFFIYCYCQITKHPKELIDIFEGYDYIKVVYESR
jgi:hypothetical protein